MNGKPGVDPPGYMVELAQYTFDKVDYRLVPWERAVEEVRAGRIDCIIGTDHEITPDLLFPSESWGNVQFGIYINRKDSWEFSDLNSLLTRKVGVVKGYTYDANIRKFMGDNADVFLSATGNDGLSKNIKLLINNRIDTLIENIAVANSKFKEMGVADKIKLVGHAGESMPMYIACTPYKARSHDLINRIDEVTKRLRDNGKLESLMNKYGLTDWK